MTAIAHSPKAPNARERGSASSASRPTIAYVEVISTPPSRTTVAARRGEAPARRNCRTVNTTLIAGPAGSVVDSAFPAYVIRTARGSDIRTPPERSNRRWTLANIPIEASWPSVRQASHAGSACTAIRHSAPASGNSSWKAATEAATPPAMRIRTAHRSVRSPVAAGPVVSGTAITSRVCGVPGTNADPREFRIKGI
jgi:hypothetical protein